MLGFYRAYLKPAPTCFDGRKNQAEAGIDCGGFCFSCEVLELEPLKTIGAVRVFSLTSGKAAFLAEISNSNESHQAQFAYRFSVYDRDDELIETIGGDGFIFALEKRFIYEVGDSQTTKEIVSVKLEIFEPRWEPIRDSLRAELSVAPVISTNVQESVIQVSGFIKNTSPIKVSNLEIIAVIFDKFGLELFASKTILKNMSGFEERTFVVNFPNDQFLKERINPELSRIFIHHD